MPIPATLLRSAQPTFPPLLVITKTSSGSDKGLKRKEPTPIRGACTVPVECGRERTGGQPRRGLQMSTAREVDGEGPRTGATRALLPLIRT